MRTFATLLLVLCSLSLSACTDSSTDPGSDPTANGRIRYWMLDSVGIPTAFVTDEGSTTPTLWLTNTAIMSQPRDGRMLVVNITPDGREVAAAKVVDSSGATLQTLVLPAKVRMPMSMSPDGRTVFFARGGDSVDEFDYYVRDVASGVDTRVTTRGDREGTVAFSADSRHVAFYEEGPSSSRADFLVVVDVDGSNRRILTDSATSTGDNKGGLAWSPRGDRIVYTRETDLQSSLWSIALDGTSRRELTPGFEYASMASYSPDGSSITFSGVPVDGTSGPVWVMSADGTSLRNVTPTLPNGHVTAYPMWSPNGKKLLYVDHDETSQGNLLGGSLWVVDVASATTKLLHNERRIMWGYWDY
jgi:Tol biopolymer transport system component